MLGRSWFDTLSSVVRRNHRHPIVQTGARVARWYLRCALNERCWNLEQNGERRVMRTIAELSGAAPLTVLDVGANVGDYTMAVLDVLPHATVHSFEIVPATRERLATRLAGQPRCLVASCGLSDGAGRLRIASRRGCDTDARVASPLLTGFSHVIACDVITGDQYLQLHGLSTIDLLKIDTEGHDLAVMKGFSGAIGAGRVAAIQFEYGTTWIPYGNFLHDAYALLAPAGYSVGRLYPDGVKFKLYDRFDDHFRMGNYVAVHESCPELQARLNLTNARPAPGAPAYSARSATAGSTRSARRPGM